MYVSVSDVYLKLIIPVSTAYASGFTIKNLMSVKVDVIGPDSHISNIEGSKTAPFHAHGSYKVTKNNHADKVYFTVDFVKGGAFSTDGGDEDGDFQLSATLN